VSLGEKITTEGDYANNRQQQYRDVRSQGDVMWRRVTHRDVYRGAKISQTNPTITGEQHQMAMIKTCTTTNTQYDQYRSTTVATQDISITIIITDDTTKVF